MAEEPVDDEMIEIGDPTEEPSAAEPPPQVVIEYRERGVPWMLIPPMIVVSAVARRPGLSQARPDARLPASAAPAPAPRPTRPRSARPSRRNPAPIATGPIAAARPARRLEPLPSRPSDPPRDGGLRAVRPTPSRPAEVEAEPAKDARDRPGSPGPGPGLRSEGTRGRARSPRRPPTASSDPPGGGPGPTARPADEPERRGGRPRPPPARPSTGPGPADQADGRGRQKIEADRSSSTPISRRSAGIRREGGQGDRANSSRVRDDGRANEPGEGRAGSGQDRAIRRSRPADPDQAAPSARASRTRDPGRHLSILRERTADRRAGRPARERRGHVPGCPVPAQEPSAAKVAIHSTGRPADRLPAVRPAPAAVRISPTLRDGRRPAQTLAPPRSHP